MARVRKRIESRKDGSKNTYWTIDFIDNFGKRKIKGGFKTKVEAERELSKVMQEINNGIYVEIKKSLTFGELAENFIKYHAEIHCKPSTLCSYNTYLKNHVLPYFGNMKVLDIRFQILYRLKERFFSIAPELSSSCFDNHCQLHRLQTKLIFLFVHIL